MSEESAGASINPFQPPWLLATLIAALTFTVFSPALRYGFINYDDDLYVYENAQVAKGLSGSGFTYALTTRDIETWAPLTWLSYQ